MVNVNVWLAPDSANLGGAQTGDGGGLTVFHAKPPGEMITVTENRVLAAGPLAIVWLDSNSLLPRKGQQVVGGEYFRTHSLSVGQAARSQFFFPLLANNLHLPFVWIRTDSYLR